MAVYGLSSTFGPPVALVEVVILSKLQVGITSLIGY